MCVNQSDSVNLHVIRKLNDLIKSRIHNCIRSQCCFIKNKMETKIQKTLTHWFPEAFTAAENSVINTDYGILRQFAYYTKKLISNNTGGQAEPFKIIHLLYSKGTLYERNAIENEFLNVLASDENPLTIKQHLEFMPEGLRAVYVKTIIEN